MRIFILEDDPKRIESFQKNMIGHEVFVSGNVQAAIEILDEGDWDMCFLDHDLDGRIYVDSNEPNTGYQLVKWIVKQPKFENTHIVIHSFNEIGRENMRNLLPDTAQVVPGAWQLLELGAVKIFE